MMCELCLLMIMILEVFYSYVMTLMYNNVDQNEKYQAYMIAQIRGIKLISA